MFRIDEDVGGGLLEGRLPSSLCGFRESRLRASVMLQFATVVLFGGWSERPGTDMNTAR